jgi:hypothetical protein
MSAGLNADANAQAAAREAADAAASALGGDTAAMAAGSAEHAMQAADATRVARAVPDIFEARETTRYLRFRKAAAAAAAEAAAFALAAIRRTPGNSERRFLAALRRDFDALQARARAESWNDGSPVPAAYLGPPVYDFLEIVKMQRYAYNALPPSSYIDPGDELPLSIYIDPSDAPKETIQGVLAALSDLHIAAGGLGLEFTLDGLNALAVEGARQ